MLTFDICIAFLVAILDYERVKIEIGLNPNNKSEGECLFCMPVALLLFSFCLSSAHEGAKNVCFLSVCVCVIHHLHKHVLDLHFAVLLFRVCANRMEFMCTLHRKGRKEVRTSVISFKRTSPLTRASSTRPPNSIRDVAMTTERLPCIQTCACLSTPRCVCVCARPPPCAFIFVKVCILKSLCTFLLCVCSHMTCSHVCVFMWGPCSDFP